MESACSRDYPCSTCSPLLKDKKVLKVVSSRWERASRPPLPPKTKKAKTKVWSGSPPPSVPSPPAAVQPPSDLGGGIQSQVDQLFAMMKTFTQTFGAVGGSPQVQLPSISNPPLGGRPQGSCPAAQGVATSYGSPEPSAAPIISLHHGISPSVNPEVLDIPLPPSGPVHAGTPVGGYSSTAPAPAGSPVGGLPGLHPVFLGPSRSPVGAPMDTNPVRQWIPSMESTSTAEPSASSGLTLPGIYPQRIPRIPISDTLSEWQSQFTAAAKPRPVGSYTGWGASAPPPPRMSVSTGGVMPGQAFTGLSTVSSTGAPAPWGCGPPLGPRQTALPIGAFGSTGTGYAADLSLPRPLQSQPYTAGIGRGYRIPKVARQGPVVSTVVTTSVTDSVIYTTGPGSAPGASRFTGPVQSVLGAFMPHQQTTPDQSSHHGVRASVDPPQGGMTVQSAIAFLASQGLATDQLSAAASAGAGSEQDTEDFTSELEYGSNKDTVEEQISFSSLLADLDSRFPGHLAPAVVSAKPTSRGLELLVGSKDLPSKARLPMAPGLDKWYSYHNKVLTGVAHPGGKKAKKHLLKTYPKSPAVSDRYTLAEGTGPCTSLDPPPNWYRLVTNSASLTPAAVQIPTKEFQELGKQVNRVLPVLSNLSWMSSGGSSVLRQILEDPATPQTPDLLLLKRYFLEILRDLEVLELQITGVSSHLMWRARDTYIGRLHPSVPQHLREGLRSGPLSGSPHLFEDSAVDEIAATLKSDLTMESHSKALKVLAGKRPATGQASASLPKKHKPKPAGNPSGGAQSHTGTAQQISNRKPAYKKPGKPGGSKVATKSKPKHQS